MVTVCGLCKAWRASKPLCCSRASSWDNCCFFWLLPVMYNSGCMKDWFALRVRRAKGLVQKRYAGC